MLLTYLASFKCDQNKSACTDTDRDIEVEGDLRYMLTYIYNVFDN